MTDTRTTAEQERDQLRDHFAGQALASINTLGRRPDWVARHCYDIADAMLAERAK